MKTIWVKAVLCVLVIGTAFVLSGYMSSGPFSASAFMVLGAWIMAIRVLND